MINHNTIHEFIIAKLKADTTLVNLLGGVDTEIREADWYGRDFSYPGVRVKVGPQTVLEGGCGFNLEVRIISFTSDSNDQALHDLSYEISELFDNKTYSNRKTLNVSMSQSTKDGNIWQQTVQLSLQGNR